MLSLLAGSLLSAVALCDGTTSTTGAPVDPSVFSTSGATSNYAASRYNSLLNVPFPTDECLNVGIQPTPPFAKDSGRLYACDSDSATSNVTYTDWQSLAANPAGSPALDCMAGEESDNIQVVTTVLSENVVCNMGDSDYVFIGIWVVVGQTFPDGVNPTTGCLEETGGIFLDVPVVVNVCTENFVDLGAGLQSIYNQMTATTVNTTYAFFLDSGCSVPAPAQIAPAITVSADAACSFFNTIPDGQPFGPANIYVSFIAGYEPPEEDGDDSSALKQGLAISALVALLFAYLH